MWSCVPIDCPRYMHESISQTKSSESNGVESYFGWYQLASCGTRFQEILINVMCKLQEKNQNINGLDFYVPHTINEKFISIDMTVSFIYFFIVINNDINLVLV